MSSSSIGAQRVGSILTQLHRHGYRCARVSGSGQRRGKRKAENGLAGDVIALAPIDSALPHLLVEVGGPKKSVAAAMRDLLALPLPGGFSVLVARCVRRSWRWHVGPDRTEAFPSLEDALDALRDA